MKTEKLQDAIGEVRDEFIYDADIMITRKKKDWTKWGAVAACLCLLVVGAVKFLGGHPDVPEIQQWSESMTAEDYFKNHEGGKNQSQSSSRSKSMVMPPYAVAVSLDAERNDLETDGLIPAMLDYQEQEFQAEYNGDGSLYKVSFLWMRRDENGLKNYSDLALTAAPKKLNEQDDVTVVRKDSDGNALPDEITVTERDGIRIVAKGGEHRQKSLSWQTDQGWFQITGSWNDSYEDVVALLDWFWEHPLSLSHFDSFIEGHIVFSSRVQQPEAFQGQIPDFQALGYTTETEKVNLGLRSGEWIPVWFEGVYTRGDTRIRWTISIGADGNAWDACLGRPTEVNEDQIKNAISQKGTLYLFMDYATDIPCMVTLYIEKGTGADAWELIQTVQNKSRVLYES